MTTNFEKEGFAESNRYPSTTMPRDLRLADIAPVNYQIGSFIGVMGAMEEEVASLKQAMEVSEVRRIGGREYILGKLFGVDTVLVFSRWGKVAAAATTATLIAEFKVTGVIFTGVAGATAEHLNIGDVVIATHLYQHDMNASPLFAKREVPFLSTTFFDVDKKLLELAHKATNLFFKDAFLQIFTNDFLHTFCITLPQIHQGVIASGDEFISNIAKVQTLISEVPETLAVEMEGASIAQVCFEYGIPFIVIRTISDRADHKASIDFPKFVSEVATHYSMGILKEMYGLLLKGF